MARKTKKPSRWGLFFLLALLLLLAIPTGRKYLERRVIKAELAEADKKIAEYEAKNRDLSKIVDYLQTPQAKEDLARDQLGMKKADEQVVVIRDEVKEKNEELVENISNPRKWFNYFFR